MERWFELWDARNASLVGAHDTREAALVVVRRSVTESGAESGGSLVLTAQGGADAEPRVIAAGEELVGLALGRTGAVVGAE